MRLRLFLLTLFLISSCSEYFEFSPYVLNTDQQQLTNKHLVKIGTKSTASFFDFTFAVLSDTHAYYEDTEDAIPHVNELDDVSFVLIAGDITDLGLLKEYEKSNSFFAKLNAPYLTVIGNHDAISNGKQIYRSMFGPYNFSFEFNNVKFILFNSNKQEFDDGTPDLNWVENELKNRENFQHVILASHISLFNPIFSASQRKRFVDLAADHNVSLVINGHGHNYDYFELPRTDGGKTTYLINGSVDKRVFNKVVVEADGIKVQKRVF